MKRRALILGWHAWGYWALTVALAAAAPTLWIALAVLGAFVLFWLFGVARAVLRRDPTVLARCVGLVAFGFAALTLLTSVVDSDIAGSRSWEDYHLGRVALGLLVVLAGMLIVALAHAGIMRSVPFAHSRGWVYVGHGRTGLWIKSVKRSWLNPCAVAVEGGYCTEGSGEGYTYWLAWLGGRWAVVDEISTMEWVT